MMSAIKRCWCYWRENIAVAKEQHEISILIVFIIWQACYFASKYWNFENQIFGDANHSKVLDICEVISIFVFSVWCLLWLPFQRHEAQQVKIDSEKQKLEGEIQSLRAQLGDRTIRKKSEDILGLYHKQLETRILTLKKTDSKYYVNNLKDGFDDESLSLIGAINTFIIETFGEGESALFSRQSGPESTDDDKSRDIFSDEKRRKWMIDRLNSYANELAEIIKRNK